ncbi:MAG TPA: UDP-glucose/GDP-mannose dehydrogenase family protein, partial [Spirochaetota bacterium]|nr:UDP-glucose/GDP-mannose dehydrogenase family protein [Spirochaetota bacterium]
MKLAVIGTGYVGLVTGTCFSEMGNDVWCVDVDAKKIENLNNGIIPIYEPGLEELVKRNHSEGRLRFTTNLDEALDDTLLAFIAVGTPPNEDGSADLSHVISVARGIGKIMNKYMIIVDKSTVPVGTAEKVRETIKKELVSRGKSEIEFDVVSNPEFLKEGNAIEDFLRPERVIIGTDNIRTAEILRELYSPFTRQSDRFIMMDIVSSELTKYAANAMLATRISFMNEISRLCELTGADIENVRRGIGSDTRVGKSFLYAGLGYGGSCFPKDVKALIKTSKDMGLKPVLLESVEEVNKHQRGVFVDKILAHYNNDVKGLCFAVWGLAFKPQTDDMREAPAVDIIIALREKGARFKAYDPIAWKNARTMLGDDAVEYVQGNYETLSGCDALILMTEWHHFRNPDFNRIKSLLKKPVIFDGRNQY